MADPVTIGIVFAVAGTRAMHKRHKRKRRNVRLSDAKTVLEQLADDGCDLYHFRQLFCNRSHAWFNTPVEDIEVQNLTRNPVILENAKYLIGLYGRSETTRTFVNQVGDIGTYEFLRRRNELAAAKDTIIVLVEAGFELAVLQEIAQYVKDDNGCGWTDDSLLEAASTLWAGDTAKEALSGQAMELIGAFVLNPDTADLVTGVVDIGIGIFENAGELVEGVEEIVFDLVFGLLSNYLKTPSAGAL